MESIEIESEWVEQARQGDARAWEALVEAHQQPVFRLAYLLLGDADDAEDVAQETFIHAYRALDRFDTQRLLRPWLLRIASNLASNWRRSAGRYLGALQRLLNNDPPTPSTRQLAEQQLEADALWQAVRKLSPADQRVIYRRYFRDCSERETAEALGVAAGTVKSRTHRALARLREILHKEYPHMIQEWTDVI